jgi:hypothetical protein
MKLNDFRNSELNQLTHVFYNPSTNEMIGAFYRHDLEIYQVERYCDEGRYAVVLCSANRLLDDRQNEKWEFLGVL